MTTRQIHCKHKMPVSECSDCYLIFLAETSVGDILLDSQMYGKSKAWRTGADKLLAALARDNKYIVSDMVIIFLESAGFGLEDYSPLGGVFKRAAKAGLIKRIDRPTKQALWLSRVYKGNSPEME